ncbi:MAG: sodium:solute symporter family protein [Spirochaetota bacterium]
MLIAGVTAYLVVTLLIGFWASRRVRDHRDFALAGKHLSYFMATSTVFATWFGSETILGSSANFVSDGFSGVIEEPFGAALCLILVGAFFARGLYRMNLTTFGDFFRVRFGLQAEVVSSVVLVFSYVSWVAAQFLALGIVFHTVTGLPLEFSIVSMSVLVTLYTTMGGMWAVSLTDTLQMGLIIAGLAAVFGYLLQQAGGWNSVLAQVPASHFSLLPQGKVSWLEYASLWMVIGLGSIPGQDVFQRVMSSRNERVAAVSSMVAGFLYLTVAMVPLFLGLVAVRLLSKGELPQDMQFLLPQLIQLKTPVWVQIVFFGALISAILSTASGALLAPSVLVSENLLAKIVRDEKKLLFLSRVSTIAIAAWALQMTLAHRHIHNLVTESSAIGLVALLLPFLFGYYARRHNPYTAVSSMLLGFVAWQLWPFIVLQFSQNAGQVPAVIAGLIGSALPYALDYTGRLLVLALRRWRAAEKRVA